MPGPGALARRRGRLVDSGEDAVPIGAAWTDGGYGCSSSRRSKAVRGTTMRRPIMRTGSSPRWAAS